MILLNGRHNLKKIDGSIIIIKHNLYRNNDSPLIPDPIDLVDLVDPVDIIDLVGSANHVVPIDTVGLFTPIEYPVHGVYPIWEKPSRGWREGRGSRYWVR